MFSGDEQHPKTMLLYQVGQWWCMSLIPAPRRQSEEDQISVSSRIAKVTQEKQFQQGCVCWGGPFSKLFAM